MADPISQRKATRDGSATRREHRRALRALLDRLETEDGPLDSAEDAAAIARYRSMLS